jgi:hypothetical protein
MKTLKTEEKQYINDYIKQYIEDAVDSEGGYAEFVMSGGYGEADLDDIKAAIAEAVEQALDDYDDDTILDIDYWLKRYYDVSALFTALYIANAIVYEYEPTIAAVTNTIFSCLIGEQEIPLDGYTDHEIDNCDDYVQAGYVYVSDLGSANCVLCPYTLIDHILKGV